MADCRQAWEDMEAYCEDCDWTTTGGNAVGNAAQHADKKGHSVKVDVRASIHVDP